MGSSRSHRASSAVVSLCTSSPARELSSDLFFLLLGVRSPSLASSCPAPPRPRRSFDRSSCLECHETLDRLRLVSLCISITLGVLYDGKQSIRRTVHLRHSMNELGVRKAHQDNVCGFDRYGGAGRQCDADSRSCKRGELSIPSPLAIATSPLPFSISSATTDALPSGLILAYTPSGAILTWCATTTAVARQPPVMKLPSMPISYNVRIVRADECLCKREDGQWGRCGRRDGDANQRAAFLRFELPQVLRTYGNPARRNGPTGSTRYTSAARW